MHELRQLGLLVGINLMCMHKEFSMFFVASFWFVKHIIVLTPQNTISTFYVHKSWTIVLVWDMDEKIRIGPPWLKFLELVCS